MSHKDYAEVPASVQQQHKRERETPSLAHRFFFLLVGRILAADASIDQLSTFSRRPAMMGD